MNRLTLKLVALAGIFCTMNPVVAASYRLDFSGISNDQSVTFSGHAILDYTTPEENFSPDTGTYENAITEFEIRFGDVLYTLAESVINGASVSNDDETFGFDAFSMTVYVTDNPDGSDYELFLLQLIDPSQMAFNGTSLPTSLSVDDFDLSQSNITLTYVSTDVAHPLDFVSLRPVPLPAGLALFMGGLGALFCMSRGQNCR